MRPTSSSAYPVTAGEWMAIIALVIHGVVFLLPADTFSLPAYLVISRIAPEPVWGVAMILASLPGLAGWALHNLLLRKIGLLISIVVFVFLGVSFILSVISTSAGPILLLIATGAFTARLKLR